MRRAREYVVVYGCVLISSSITSLLGLQIQAVGQSILSGKLGPRLTSDVENALMAWRDLDNLLLHEDRDIMAKLKEAQAGLQ